MSHRCFSCANDFFVVSLHSKGVRDLVARLFLLLFSSFFLENSTMKKSLIPVLLVLAVFAGCTSKGNNTTTDTTAATQQAMLPHTYKVGPATTMINPAVVNPAPPPAISPITLTSANNIGIEVIFNGNLGQTVTVTNNPGGGAVANFASADGGNTLSDILTPPGAGGYTITPATAGGNSYTHVTPNLINVVGNHLPDEQTFTDGAGNMVTIFVVDCGPVN